MPGKLTIPMVCPYCNEKIQDMPELERHDHRRECATKHSKNLDHAWSLSDGWVNK